METLRIKTIVPKNHRVEITLPPEVPEGPAEMVVTIKPTASLSDSDEERLARRSEVLADLRKLREKYAHRNFRLSEAVIEVRREEG